MKYSEAKEFNPTMTECFFAFSNDQYAEGKAKSIPGDEKIFSARHGLYGTDKGITLFMEEMTAHHQFIVDNCDPQDCYNYEFVNHECGYTGSDADALSIVKDYWPEAEVKRYPAELMEEI